MSCFDWSILTLTLTRLCLLRFAQDVRTGEKLPGALEDIQGNVIEQSRVIASGWKALSEDERSVRLSPVFLCTLLIRVRS